MGEAKGNTKQQSYLRELFFRGGGWDGAKV
jgi:hypothetical protein